MQRHSQQYCATEEREPMAANPKAAAYHGHGLGWSTRVESPEPVTCLASDTAPTVVAGMPLSRSSLFLGELQFQDQVKELNSVLQGQTAPIVQIGWAVFNAS